MISMHNLDQLFMLLLSHEVRKLISPLWQASRRHLARHTENAIEACQPHKQYYLRDAVQGQWQNTPYQQTRTKTCAESRISMQDTPGYQCRLAVTHKITKNSYYKPVHIFSWFTLPFSHRNIFGLTGKMWLLLKGRFVSLHICCLYCSL